MADFGRKPDPGWDELDNEDKIERLSKVVQNQNVLLSKMASYLNQLVDHDHLNGKIVQPIGKPKPKYTFNDMFPHSDLKDSFLY